jgi:hypothetical protein
MSASRTAFSHGVKLSFLNFARVAIFVVGISNQAPRMGLVNVAGF